MKITYIFHSGFAIETERCVLILDYWLDPAQVIPEIMSKGKPTYVFSSHFHEDHFTSEIFSWKEKFPKNRFTYILSKDILRHKRAKQDDANTWLAKGGVWKDETMTVYATGSNDSGVSLVIETEGKTIFHAGDLNNWYARFLTDDYKGGKIQSVEFGEVDPLKKEKQYLGELKDIQKISKHFDIVMFPIDGRIGNGYTRGGRQFIERFSIEKFIPMHFAATGFESAWRMKEFTDDKGISFWSISNEGESINIESPTANIR